MRFALWGGGREDRRMKGSSWTLRGGEMLAFFVRRDGDGVHGKGVLGTYPAADQRIDSGMRNRVRLGLVGGHAVSFRAAGPLL